MHSERQVVISNPLGLHVRPSTRLAEIASKFNSDVRVIKDGLVVNAKSSIDLLTLAAIAGTQLTLRAEGEDATQAVEELSALIEGGFEEK